MRIVVVSTYSIICSKVKTVINERSFYSTYSPNFSRIMTVASKTNLFYPANLYCLD